MKIENMIFFPSKRILMIYVRMRKVYTTLHRIGIVYSILNGKNFILVSINRVLYVIMKIHNQ